jgi:hypothetical protein
MESAIRSANKELAEAIKQDQADSARVSGGFIFSMDSPVKHGRRYNSWLKTWKRLFSPRTFTGYTSRA